MTKNNNKNYQVLIQNNSSKMIVNTVIAKKLGSTWKEFTNKNINKI